MLTLNNTLLIFQSKLIKLKFITYCDQNNLSTISSLGIYGITVQKFYNTSQNHSDIVKKKNNYYH